MESNLSASTSSPPDELGNKVNVTSDTFGIPQDRLEEFNDGYSDNTRLSLESQDFDSNQGTLSSESAEPIHENFQDMGIDNWHDASDHFTPVPSNELNTMPALLDGFDGPSIDSEMADTPSSAQGTARTNNMQLVLYVSPNKHECNNYQDKENQVVPGSCGLSNIGNTCYMNAGLQCLTATKPLVHFFVSDSVSSSPAEQACVTASPAVSSLLSGMGDNTGALTSNFAQLMSKMWAGKYRVLAPTEFKKSLGQRHMQFKDTRQHDCQEFLALLLDTLHEQLNTAGKGSAALPLADPPPKVKKELAVAGCSRQEEECSPPQDLKPMSPQQPSPGRSSNIDVAKQLAKRQADHLEKNHVEQARSPQSQVAGTSSTPPATSLVSPLSPSLPGLRADTSPLLKNIAIQDYFKEAKTSNVNVLSPQQRGETCPNNQIKFDSEKFGSGRLALGGAATAVSPRGIRNLGLRDMVLVENPNNLSECSSKDEACSLQQTLQEPLHKKLKQTNLEQRQPCLQTSVMDKTELCDGAACEAGNAYKRLKLGASYIKNKEEANDDEGSMETESEADLETGEVDAEDLAQQETAAQAHWDQHLASNQSVIVDTFQGQFRSTVVCSVCHHKSVTFEPFMYLSVPLPRAIELHLEVTYVPADPDLPALKYPVQMHRMATVEQLREEVRRLATAEDDADLAVCEGMEHRVSKIMHPQDQLEKANRDRDLFVIEVPKLDWPGAQICDDLLKLEDDMDIGESSFIGPLTREAFLKEPTGADDLLDLTPNLPMAVPQLRLQDQEETLPWPKCNICLEEVEISNRPLKHGDHCDCVLCASCLQECKAHQIKSQRGHMLKCPMCHEEVDPDVDFVVMTSINSKCKPSKWVLTITVVFRVDEEGAEYNNQRNSKLYGNPRVLHLPNKISGAQLYEFLQPYAPSRDFTVLQVGGNGLFCSVCLFNSHCKGCALSSSPTEEIELQPNSMLAVRTTQLPAEQTLTVEHPSLLQRRKEEKLTLDDCLDAFTQPETLDAENPWFCPSCKQNQCATKTISVWRYPPVVIIYLKRFVFHEGRSIKLDNKVAFPLKGLTLKEASAGGRRSGSLYDLYSCVCHIGGTTGSGHYMAYTRNPVSLEWYRYNDSSVLRQRPELEDHNQAYVLFYQRSELATAPAVL